MSASCTCQEETEPHAAFNECFSLAQRESSLGKQGERVLALMYGLAGRGYWQSEQVGEELRVSTERIHQILRTSLLIIHCLGTRQINQGEPERANARLLLYLQAAIRPEEAGALDRMQDFAERELTHLPRRSHAYPLIVYLLYGRGKMIRQTLTRLRGLERRRIVSEHA